MKRLLQKKEEEMEQLCVGRCQFISETDEGGWNLNKTHLIFSMWQKIKCVAVSICSHVYLITVYYFVFNIRSNVRWFSDVRSKLPTCVNGIALNCGNPKED